MKQPHILVDMNEASSVVMKFIGTDKFDEVVSAVENNAKAGFTAGLSFALCLIMAEAKTYQTYVYHVDEQKAEVT